MNSRARVSNLTKNLDKFFIDFPFLSPWLAKVKHTDKGSIGFESWMHLVSTLFCYAFLPAKTAPLYMMFY